MYNNELYHFGIRGMKWGVRRYQNEDGTLTEAGISKYKKIDNKLYNNVLDVEENIARANYHNLSEGRRHDNDNMTSSIIRAKAIKQQKQGQKYVDKLFKAGYFQQVYGLDPKNTSYESFMSAIETSAAKDFVKKYGRTYTTTKHDPNGSMEYEESLINYTASRRRK